jgi:peroxiredoxin
MKVSVFLIITISGVLIVGGCLQDGGNNQTGNRSMEWMEIELNDILTGETFRISDFAGKPILVESFAVWCSTCLKQQRNMRDLISQTGDSIVHISLNTDPNEDEETVRNFLKQHGFDWHYAVAPKELTDALIEEFGLDVVNAPLAPVVLVCEDQSARILKRGLKSAEELRSAVDAGC